MLKLIGITIGKEAAATPSLIEQFTSIIIPYIQPFINLYTFIIILTLLFLYLIKIYINYKNIKHSII